MRLIALLILLVGSTVSHAVEADGQARGALAPVVEAVFSQGPASTRLGLVVATLEGETLIAVAPDARFIAASNTKMFTTAAAYAALDALQAEALGTGVRLEDAGGGAVNVVLHGRGDGLLRSTDDCAADCLQTLADAVATALQAGGVRRVGDIVGDDSWFPDERWGQGMSWNNIQSRYGTGISALTLDDNAIAMTVTPAAVGRSAAVSGVDYYRIDNRVVTVAGAGAGETVRAERAPNSTVVRLTGTIAAGAKPLVLYLSVDDPAHYAAWRMRGLLRARGISVMGEIGTQHRALAPFDDPAIRGSTPAPKLPQREMLMSLPAPLLADDMRIINKQSQNLHADLMLRRVGKHFGSGSVADGQAAVRAVMAAAGIAPESVTLADGSGMSSYNRITPRAATALLIWIARQPWGAAWRETLPIAGTDGTLRNRFKGTSLEGKLFAKTGSLNAARALSGYFVARSGRTLVFSALAADMPDGADAAASATVDRALVAVAEAL